MLGRIVSMVLHILYMLINLNNDQTQNMGFMFPYWRVFQALNLHTSMKTSHWRHRMRTLVYLPVTKKRALYSEPDILRSHLPPAAM